MCRYFELLNCTEGDEMQPKEIIQDWFNNLKDKEKYELMEKHYPEMSFLVGLEFMWGKLSFDKQVDIYNIERGKGNDK